MRRLVYDSLIKWKNSADRKPLMVYGARQVGKTYILKEFGNKEFENLVYINCYHNDTIKEIFNRKPDINTIIDELKAYTSQQIVPGKTFLFFDEVQEIPSIVASLKYFCEDRPDLFVATAGSLLGVMNMTGISFPTGKVDILHVYPMTYTEFLWAMGEDKKVDLLNSSGSEESLNRLLLEYTDLLRQYYYVGGMPEAVKKYVEDKDLTKVREIQLDILSAYEADIAKHAGRDALKARMVLQSIPQQLARENKKFVFGQIKKGARGAEYENAIQWLVDAGLIYKVENISKAAIPLKFYMDRNAFKLYLLDVGLLGAMSQTPASLMLVGNNVFSEFKGAFTENYVLTQLKTIKNIVIGYYTKENSSLEIDFVVQQNERLTAIEVKAEENVKSKSLRQFVVIDNADSGMGALRLSMKGFINQDWMTNKPLFAILQNGKIV